MIYGCNSNSNHFDTIVVPSSVKIVKNSNNIFCIPISLWWFFTRVVTIFYICHFERIFISSKIHNLTNIFIILTTIILLSVIYLLYIHNHLQIINALHLILLLSSYNIPLYSYNSTIYITRTTSLTATSIRYIFF